MILHFWVKQHLRIACWSANIVADISFPPMVLDDHITTYLVKLWRLHLTWRHSHLSRQFGGAVCGLLYIKKSDPNLFFYYLTHLFPKTSVESCLWNSIDAGNKVVSGLGARQNPSCARRSSLLRCGCSSSDTSAMLAVPGASTTYICVFLFLAAARERNVRVLKGVFTNMKARVQEGFSWVNPRVGYSFLSPCNCYHWNLLITGRDLRKW
jgi:hypothetical protein